MRQTSLTLLLGLASLFFISPTLGLAQTQPTARDLGVPFDGRIGPNNAITDVPGVEVGYATIIEGEGPLRPGAGPVRTGVTAILPRGKSDPDPVFGGWFALNGAGEMTGTTWLEERGFLEGPVLITNTHSVGVVRDAAVEWMLDNGWDFNWATPVVAETYDGHLSDINGFHVTKEHAFAALDAARDGPVPEGNVGGGTGAICHGFKGGTGTASRRGPRYTLGVLVQCNYGSRSGLRIAGVPVGEELTAEEAPPPSRVPTTDGSIIVVIATDAPLLPHQLKRLAKRASLGIGRMGGIAGNGSGDIFVAFSTANPGASAANPATLEMLSNEALSAFFRATVDATEEAIVNTLVAAETMTGTDGFTVHALPHEPLRRILERHDRLAPEGEAARGRGEARRHDPDARRGAAGRGSLPSRRAGGPAARPSQSS
ncbi:MAG: P1 family peptidase [Gemmatimonadota bacterium]